MKTFDVIKKTLEWNGLLNIISILISLLITFLIFIFKKDYSTNFSLIAAFVFFVTFAICSFIIFTIGNRNDKETINSFNLILKNKNLSMWVKIPTPCFGKKALIIIYKLKPYKFLNWVDYGIFKILKEFHDIGFKINILASDYNDKYNDLQKQEVDIIFKSMKKDLEIYVGRKAEIVRMSSLFKNKISGETIFKSAKDTLTLLNNSKDQSTLHSSYSDNPYRFSYSITLTMLWSVLIAEKYLKKRNLVVILQRSSSKKMYESLKNIGCYFVEYDNLILDSKDAKYSDVGNNMNIEISSSIDSRNGFKNIIMWINQCVIGGKWEQIEYFCINFTRCININDSWNNFNSEIYNHWSAIRKYYLEQETKTVVSLIQEIKPSNGVNHKIKLLMLIAFEFYSCDNSYYLHKE